MLAYAETAVLRDPLIGVRPRRIPLRSRQRLAPETVQVRQHRLGRRHRQIVGVPLDAYVREMLRDQRGAVLAAALLFRALPGDLTQMLWFFPAVALILVYGLALGLLLSAVNVYRVAPGTRSGRPAAAPTAAKSAR